MWQRDSFLGPEEYGRAQGAVNLFFARCTHLCEEAWLLVALSLATALDLEARMASVAGEKYPGPGGGSWPFPTTRIGVQTGRAPMGACGGGGKNSQGMGIRVAHEATAGSCSPQRSKHPCPLLLFRKERPLVPVLILPSMQPNFLFVQIRYGRTDVLQHCPCSLVVLSSIAGSIASPRCS